MDSCCSWFAELNLKMLSVHIEVDTIILGCKLDVWSLARSEEVIVVRATGAVLSAVITEFEHICRGDFNYSCVGSII